MHRILVNVSIFSTGRKSFWNVHEQFIETFIHLRMIQRLRRVERHLQRYSDDHFELFFVEDINYRNDEVFVCDRSHRRVWEKARVQLNFHQ